MQGKFKYDSPRWRAIVDSYLSTIFCDRCGGMEAIIRNETGDVSDVTNKLILVVADDAGEQFSRIKDDATYTENFTTFKFVSGYMKYHSELKCFCGAVVDEGRNVAVVYFDGNTKKNAARALIGAAPAYFRYLFRGQSELTERECKFAVRVANPAVALKDVI